jgi:putative nucleotidyltransferase with HDIG domain
MKPEGKNRVKTPTKDTCFRLMQEMKMLNHIFDHSRQVCRVAMCLARHLNGDSVPMNLQLVQAAALLHDITKTRSFQTGENHASTGGELLTDLGYPDVGNIIRQHVRLDSYFESELPREAEIVNYADKIVLHDKIVRLKQRKAYIFKKYGKGPEDKIRLERLWENTARLEQRLFRFLPFSPRDLSDHLKPE